MRTKTVDLARVLPFWTASMKRFLYKPQRHVNSFKIRELRSLTVAVYNERFHIDLPFYVVCVFSFFNSSLFKKLAFYRSKFAVPNFCKAAPVSSLGFTVVECRCCSNCCRKCSL